jgi:FkbM family methyltransferase
MNPGTFDSFAQNGEDVVLWRALGHVDRGRYIDVGANDPTYLSITKAFYDHGWRGITVEPIDYLVQRHREERPADRQVQAAITADPGEPVVLHEIPESGLSTLLDDVSEQHRQAGWKVRDIIVPTRSLNEVLDEAGWRGSQIHFMTVDVEGAEAEVLKSIDLSVWRPWVLVIEATAPNSTRQTHSVWEPAVLAAGYEFCLFDGLSRYYVAAEQAEQLRPNLDRAANVLDLYSTQDHRKLAERAAVAADDAIHWRAAALERWSEEMVEKSEELAQARAQVHDLTRDLIETRATLSWRITRPLRGLRRFRRLRRILP